MAGKLAGSTGSRGGPATVSKSKLTAGVAASGERGKSNSRGLGMEPSRSNAGVN